MKLETRQDIERKIYSRIVKDALASGYGVSVDYGDEDELALYNSTNYKEIMDAGFSTDQDTLIFVKNDKDVGWVFLVYGNCGWDVISDYVATGEIENILTGAHALADKLEKQYA